MMDFPIESVLEQLSSKGIRLSYQRMKVLEHLYQKEGHPTVDEIYCALSGDIPSLSKVTVYNTIHTLVDAGLVKVVDIDGTEKRYDIILTSHGHFLCKDCGNIFNFEVNIDQISVTGLDKFEISQKSVTFRGLCPDCRRKIGEGNQL